jgi:guanylate kinase
MASGPGSFFVVSAPSGAGKTSLVNAIVGRVEGVHRSVSYTTRPPRPGERDGIDYRFIDRERFAELRDSGALLEHAEVFGHWYGTSRVEVAKGIEAGTDLILVIDWQGAHQVRERWSGAVSIFILPPSHEALARRLRARSADTTLDVDSRLRWAKSELSHVTEFDYVIVNDDFATARTELEAVIRCQRLRAARALVRHRDLLTALLGQ